MMKSLVMILMFLFLTIVAVFGQDKMSKRELKMQAKQEAYSETKELVKSGAFSFTADWASTQRGRRINLIGNPNSFILKDSTVTGDLPYFGEVQMYDMSGDGGINFDGTAMGLTAIANDKKMKGLVMFSVKSKAGNEVYNCTLTIVGSRSASLSITSSARNRITYDGTIKPLETKL
ncbi:DUF4251 domain-containing protein [Reichenbachiella agarivorans]|uniref:DUF4251 domain-containing protein n=1 Tax=Reichenbachiella agarivorans TaxID=2979464 RepID=A0ABY6CJC0_9BACT|nr:DUF4251 domain-containing protein [Reichenbachiella agarivorans]UXP30622.1 DUF4251 domain-containing protein [Reichenbachiella agarivorans]